jgi:hypothetical protein
MQRWTGSNSRFRMVSQVAWRWKTKEQSKR